MTHRMFAAAVLGAVACLAGTPADGLAFGGKLFGRHTSGGCGGCAPAPACAAPCAAPCAPQVTWVDKEVTVMEPRWSTRDVAVTVMQSFPVTKDVTCQVAVPKTRIEKRQVTTCEMIQVPQTFEYCVYEKQMGREVRKVCEMVQTPREVVVDVTTYECTPRTVTETIEVCRRVPVAPAPCGGCDTPCGNPCAKSYNDSCGRRGLFARMCGKKTGGGCGSPCGSPCAAPAPCYTTVTEKVPVTRTVYDTKPVTKKVKQIVVDCKPVWKDVTVDVCRMIPVKKTGTRMVCQSRPVVKTIDVCVNYCEYVTQTRKVTSYECRPVAQTVKQQYCEMVPVKKMIKVCVPAPMPAPVAVAAVPCAAPCAPAACNTGCDSCGRQRHRLFGGGLFHRGCKGGCGGC